MGQLLPPEVRGKKTAFRCGCLPPPNLPQGATVTPTHTPKWTQAISRWHLYLCECPELFYGSITGSSSICDQQILHDINYFWLWNSKLHKKVRILYKVVFFLFQNRTNRIQFFPENSYCFIVLSTCACFHLDCVFSFSLHLHIFYVHKQIYTLTAGIFFLSSLIFFVFGDILCEVAAPFVEKSPTSTFGLSKNNPVALFLP